ncbi:MULTISPECIES: AAA family ATPase [Paenibacillus]|jgi:stage V sporulation protein K|uniref:AAA family ATPase n=1 Tax=Paenibacillus polymyxa TaxID=1406 RepID=A0AAP4E9H4_PAEPO|nr:MULTISPECIES: AAA family ATPase [Paenibacillus]APB75596.1 Holliday junction branch migration DNA helicase RuvB [Paenibacillus polymyxa]MDH2330950.1 AAA family ATPase [Paenibacillus polymyxa]OMF71930.1 AAA family ATPase [Paenibacillus peoriae]OMF79831.1 AAA family ATPase [Paenibacillus peoriae]POR25570.1 AAA family ATPase [Paenibacillus polymyxa]
MNGRGIAAGKRSEERPSRQINVVLRSPEPIASVTVDETEAVASTKSQALPQYLSLYQEIQKELDHLVGLDNIKDLVFEVYAFLQIAHMRTDAGLLSNAHVYHMIFKGNPGTGKTTVARIIAKMLQKMGVLSKGHLIEVERADLVGEYIGHTAQKTRDLVKKSLGGVLFIDEAYSLARGGEKDFGKEAIDTLVKSMEDQKNQFILILAGYSGEMDFFLRTNPGLPSRFPIQLDFPDYTVDQLIQISELMAKERDYILMPQSIIKMKEHLLNERNDSLHAFSNARYVRNVIEKAIRHQAVRLLNQYRSGQPGKQELMTLRPEDLKMDKR